MKILNINPKWYLLAAALLSILFIYFSACTGCKKSEPPKEPQVIEQKSKPIEDSLNGVIVDLRKQIDSLKVASVSLKKESVKKKQSVISSINNAKESISKEDYEQVMSDLNHIASDYEAYVMSTDKELETQGQTITKQEQELKASYAKNELEKSKFKDLSIAYNSLNAELVDNQKKLFKTERKLRRAKFVNKIFIPAAVIATLIAL